MSGKFDGAIPLILPKLFLFGYFFLKSRNTEKTDIVTTMKNKVFTAQLTNIKRNIRKNAKAPLTGSTELRNIRTNSKE